MKSVNPKSSLNKKSGRLTIRNATLKDVPGLVALVERVYQDSNIPTYTEGALNGQINHFPDGQLVAVYDQELVGYCASFLISGKIALKPHTWVEITGNGYASRHNPDGEFLYGMEVCVDPQFRGYRIGQRFYNARKQLCQELGLKGIIFAGRLPSYTKKAKRYPNIDDYIQQIVQKKLRDPVLSFQLHNNFEVLGVIKDYLPEDRDSLGYGVHLIWHNPNVPEESEIKRHKNFGGRLQETIRIGTVQYMMRKVSSFEEFVSFVEYFVDVIADYSGDFVVFPELFTLQLLSIEDQRLSPAESISALTKYTDRFTKAMRDMALRYNINIIGGSHPTQTPLGHVENISYIFLRDGSIHMQSKIHPTPDEIYWWNIEGGNTLKAIETDCGSIGVLICYDAEFPELARHLVDQGVSLIFVPFCTAERQGYLRVRYCSQARAVENQVYVIMSGNVGNLPNVANMDVQYAQSCILTPCDFPFSRDGIAADTTPNVETIALADVRPDALRTARNAGTVQNMKDRRHDLYSVLWRGK